MKQFFSSLFGQFSWQRPVWLNNIRNRAATNPALFWSMIIGFLVLLGIIVYGYQWDQNRPRQASVTAHIIAPAITPNAKELVPHQLIIDYSKSVAPLKQINKEVTSGITLDPNMPGTWLWETDNRLVFTPKQDWPAGQTYNIHFAKNVFAPNVNIESLNYSFATQPFKISIAEFKFYQDPENADLRQAVATLHFNYQVNTASLENNTTLILQEIKNAKLDRGAERFKFTMTYDENKRIGYLHSESLPLANLERYLALTVDKGVKSASGSAATTEAVTQNVLIPDISHYFKVSNAAATIVRNDADRPEQILTLETSLGVTAAALKPALHVYLLPQDYPATSVEAEKKNYQWQNPGEVTPNILALSTPLDLTTLPAERDYATLHSYKFKTQTPRFIYLKLDKGVQGFGRFTLAQDYVAVIKTPDYPKEIGFLHKGSLLAFTGEKKLSVVVRGLPAVKFDFARVLPDDVNQLVTQTDGNFGHPSFVNQTFNENNISEIFSEIKKFAATDLAKEQYTALDLGKYLATKTNMNGGPRGLFLLRAQGWDADKNTALDVKSSRLILITDLGLLVKNNSDGTQDLFVQSITQGKPIANASVAILGKNGLPLLTHTTDAQGHVSFPTLRDDYTDAREPTVYLARLGNDVSFIPYNNTDRQLNYSRFDVGGLYNNNTNNNNQDSQNLTAYLFSDRGIYRPGDTVHVGMIVKQAFARSQAAGLPVEATIMDSRGATALAKKFTLDATGYFSFDFPTDPNSPTGQYAVSLYTVKDNHANNVLGSITLQVAEFLPDRLRITAHLSREQTSGWISPTDLTAKVGLWNLYGAPATDRKISSKILLTPQSVQFKEYPNYTFVDPLLDPKKPPKIFTDTLPDTRTNDQGQAEVNLKLDRFDKSTYQLTFFAEGFEAEGGRSVVTQTKALVSSLPYFIGYKPDGDLNFIKQNSQRNVNFIAINPQLKPQALANLKMQLLALHPVTTLVKKPDGTYQYQSLIQTNVVNTHPLILNESGMNYALPTQQIGDFAVVILDQNNAEVSRVKYSVVGTSQVPLPKNAELTIKLNEIEYTAGDDIELQITAPYTGSGLITIERDKVYVVQWFKASTTSSVQKIRIPKDFQGNGYVNVAFIRDWNSPEIFINPLSYSIVPFSVSYSEHKINIDLTAPALVQPGDTLTMSYKSDKPGKIIVFAVDEGILQVTHHDTPDPLGYFFQKHALEVTTQQIVDQILPKFIQDRELSAVGGDQGTDALLKNLNPFKRKTDLPVVYWSGIVDTDTTPRQLTYPIPDYFNGSIRVMAVAAAANAVGAASKTSEVRGPFVISPNVPTFVAPGDTFEITASIANNVQGSGDNALVSVQLDTSSELEVLDSAHQTLTIKEGQEKTVRFKLKAKSLLGSAELTLTANHVDKSSKMKSTLSVRPASAYTTTVNSGSSQAANKPLSLDRELYPEYRTVEAAISASPLILVAGLQRYLDNFPFGCTEQVTSRAFPLLALANQPWLVKDPRAISDKVKATVQKLAQRQMTSGAFSYWPDVGNNASNAFASVYAMHFLTEARAQGFDVPSDMLRAGLNYLKELAAQNVSNLDQARVRAYAIYVLTRNEFVTSNYLTDLLLYLEKDTTHAWQKDIISAYIAATYQLLKSYPDAERFIDYFKPQTKQDVTTDFNSGAIANAQYLYLIARHFPDRLPKVGESVLTPLITSLNIDEINTVLSSYASLALAAYGQAYQMPSGINLSISETLKDGRQQILTASNEVYQLVNIDNQAKAINFNNPNKQIYFYQLMQAGFDKNLPSDAIKRGIEIYREYRDAHGDVVDKVNLGEEVEVHIQVRALNNRYLSNVAIVDLLPGGFEVVRDTVSSENLDYVDSREDRVIFFGSVSPDAKEIVYRIKATNAGKYSVPPIFAGAMYDPGVRGRSVAGNITIGVN